MPASFRNRPHHGILGAVYGLNNAGAIFENGDNDGVPYTILGYANGPGYRRGARVDPNRDTTPGFGGAVPSSTSDSAYLQEATVPLLSETHAGEDVMIYAVGRTAENVRGTVLNTKVFDWIKTGYSGRGSRPAQPDPDPDPDPDPPPPSSGSCTPTTTALQFDGGYAVSMCYRTPSGEEGQAKSGVWSSSQSTSRRSGADKGAYMLRRYSPPTRYSASEI